MKFIKHKPIRVSNFLGDKLINEEINWPLDSYEKYTFTLITI